MTVNLGHLSEAERGLSLGADFFCDKSKDIAAIPAAVRALALDDVRRRARDEPPLPMR